MWATLQKLNHVLPITQQLAKRRSTDMEFELGEAIPWEPIPPGQLPIPGREERADRLHRTLENDQDYY